MHKIWESLRNSQPIVAFRSLLPHWFVNKIYHWPKALLANIIYFFPARGLVIIGITGTKGKTSTAHILFHILKSCNQRTALISSISAQINGIIIDTGLHVTNPSAFQLQKLLSLARRKKCRFAVLEVTSHGLTQYRNWGINFALGVFTQITSDHIDYHAAHIAYKRAKAILIRQSQRVIFNRWDPQLGYLKNQARKQKVPFKIYQGKRYDFQSQNLTAALTAAEELGIEKKEALKAMKDFPGILGRMEVVSEEPFLVVIDFAHTPESLKLALINLRSLVADKGRLIAVFGCAGERDPARRKMGAVAAGESDFFIITAEDPRSESLEKISQEIASYALQAGARQISEIDLHKQKEKINIKRGNFTIIQERQAAINAAIGLAKPGDVVGLFGKGHEKSMCFGTREIPWSEHAAVARALRRRGIR